MPKVSCLGPLTKLPVHVADHQQRRLRLLRHVKPFSQRQHMRHSAPTPQKTGAHLRASSIRDGIDRVEVAHFRQLACIIQRGADALLARRGQRGSRSRYRLWMRRGGS